MKGGGKGNMGERKGRREGHREEGRKGKGERD